MSKSKRSCNGIRYEVHCHRRLASLCVVALTLLADGCTKYQLLNATVPYTGYTRTSDIAYAALPRQTLDVYRPRGAKIPAAIVVFLLWRELARRGKERVSVRRAGARLAWVYRRAAGLSALSAGDVPGVRRGRGRWP